MLSNVRYWRPLGNRPCSSYGWQYRLLRRIRLVFRRPAPNNASHGGDLVSTWAANPLVHAEVQITS